MPPVFAQEVIGTMHVVLPRLKTQLGPPTALSPSQAAAFMSSAAAPSAGGEADAAAAAGTPGGSVTSTPSPLISRFMSHLGGAALPSPRGSTDSDA